jgi:hypothetical protein
MYMEMKRKQTPLKIEFKQFQRLPELPIIIRLADADGAIQDTRVRKVGMASLMIKEDRFGARSLAE